MGYLRFEKYQINNDQKVAHNWLTTIDSHGKDAYAYAGHNKKVIIFTHLVNTPAHSKFYINKLEFVPNREIMQLIVATYGGGIFHIDSRKMKLESF